MADELKLTSKDTSPNVVAAGLLVSLWTWAIQNAYSGDLSACSDRTIADAARFRRKPDVFVRALISAGWLDEDRRLHDWEEYTLLLIKRMDRQKEQNRERVRRYRSKDVTPHGNAARNGDCNVTETPRNAPTIPNHTIPAIIDSGNNTVADMAAPQDAPAPFDGKSFTRFWDAYPVKIDRDGAWTAWCTIRPDAKTAANIISALTAWKASSRWAEDGGRFIPQAAKFLSKEHWRSPPAPTAAAATKGREMDEDEQEYIRQIMQEEI